MISRITILSLFFFLLDGCSQEENNARSNQDNNDGFSENSIKLTSLITASAEKAKNHMSFSTTASQFDCTTVSDIYQSSGSCISPVQASGGASSANFDLVRIAGPSEFLTSGELLSSAPFDLFDPSALVTNNTLRGAYDTRNTYPSLSLITPYYYIKFPLTYYGGTTKWVTLFLAQYGQPFSSSLAVQNAIANCDLTEEASQESNYTQMDRVDGLVFNRGDYLYCVKNNESDSCASSDFMWLDLSNKSLVATRPENPNQAHALVNDPITCSIDDGRVGYDFGNFGIYATIKSENKFKLWADFSHGELSQQWSDTDGLPVGDSSLEPSNADSWISPYYVYYYQDCPNEACASIVEGAQLDVDFIFDIHGMIFIENKDEDALNTEANIGNILSSLSIKSQWAFDQRSKANIIGYDAVDIGGVDLNAVISVTRAVNNPPDKAVVNCPGDDRC